ncbi:hypothetical protein MNBD_NITROSPINAE03-391 [hydrothermal vent metagenome]|uniref:Ice-binding protein C-terminal domain-containing protein n=1 Tax=hydrothermal vent metagenome TaxID=652676 RepID=A0A3B1C6B5_9ZZZZ
MKKTTILMAALVMLLVGAPQAKATPMYYTFEGLWTSWGDNAGAILAKFGSSGIPALLTYTVVIDFDLVGTYELNDGTVAPMFGTFNADAYRDSGAGDYLSPVNGGYYLADPYTAEYNYGYFGASNTLYLNSDSDKMFITSPISWSTVLEGATGFSGYNKAYREYSAYSYIYSSLTLTSISDTAPVAVPEPSILLLLGSGLLGLGMFRRVRQEG